jgi:hypothetical protein
MFDEMVDLTEQWLADHSEEKFDDPRGYAAVLVAMQAGLLAMHEHLSRALGADILDSEGYLRMIRALVDFYSRPLLSPELAGQAQAAIDQITQGKHSSPHRRRPAREGNPR